MKGRINLDSMGASMLWEILTVLARHNGDFLLIPASARRFDVFLHVAAATKLTTSTTATHRGICDANMYSVSAANVIRRYDAVAAPAVSRQRLLCDSLLYELPDYKAAAPLSLAIINIRFIRPGKLRRDKTAA